MPRLNKDEKKVQLAQKAYDKGLDNFLTIIEDLNEEIIEINDILRGYAMGEDDPKYQISTQQHAALKQRFDLWKSFVQSPDKILAHVNNELRKKHKGDSGTAGGSEQGEGKKPAPATFSTSANDS